MNQRIIDFFINLIQNRFDFRIIGGICHIGQPLQLPKIGNRRNTRIVRIDFLF